jgi:hypothetical protein
MFALMHSPFLGPPSWDAVSSALGGQGERSQLLDLRIAFQMERDFYGRAAAMAAEQIRSPVTLVVHSGAGALVPQIVRSAAGLAEAVIFVDALLPHPRRSWFDTAPAVLAAHIRASARSGLAPPWPRWLPNEALAQLLPDIATRETLIASAPALPLAYLEESAPESSAWPLPRGCGYLQLSSGYDAEATQARGLGWPVERFNGHHLSIMTEPDLIAAAIVAMAASLAD